LNRDDALTFCSRLAGAAEDYPFEDAVADFKVGGPMFALIMLDVSPGFVNLKALRTRSRQTGQLIATADWRQ
jgi:predicted DNA-binding protein (MmcQ/YjbR family)